jgi:YHS domain-containing protein
MKLKLILPLIALAALIVGVVSRPAFSQDNSPGKKILYYTCPMHPSVKTNAPGNCPYCGMELEAVYADEAAKSTATNALASSTNSVSASDTKPIPYPLSTCVVDGMQLGSMGAPYVFVYQGQEVKMCCANCKPKFNENPAKYMKIIKDAEAKK